MRAWQSRLRGTVSKTLGKTALSLSLALSPLAHARGETGLEEWLFGDMPVLVASTLPESVFQAVSNVYVIDQEMLSRFSFSSVGEAVEVVAGMSVLRTHLKKRIPTSRGIVQEHYANKVLVMINNVPAWHAVTGEGSLDRVDLNDVERIEVLKGPASVLYGSNAYTGAVNIVLKSALVGESKFGLVGGAGSGRGGGYNGLAGSHRSGAHFATAGEGSSLFVSAAAAKETWPQHLMQLENGAPVFMNEYARSRNFTAAGKYKNHSFFLNSTEGEENSFGIAISTTGAVGGAGKNHLIDLQEANYTFDWAGEKMSLHYSLTYDRSRRDLPRSADDNTRSDILGSRLVNLIKLNAPLGPRWHLEVGGDHDSRRSFSYNNYNVYENRILAENNMRDLTLEEWSAFGQVGLDWEKLKFLAGARRTKNQLFGQNLSSRGTIVWAFSPSNSLKLIAGQSFRTPSLFELNFRTSPATVFGDKDLRPEKSDSVELAYLTSWRNLFLQATGYTAAYKDTIGRNIRNNAKTGFVSAQLYENLGDFYAKGADLEIKYRLPSAYAFLNLNYVDGTKGDEEPGTNHYNFRYVPKQTLSGGVSKDVGPLFASAVAHWRGKTRGKLSPIGSTTEVDAALGHRWKSDRYAFEHEVSVKNASQEEVFVPEYVRRNINALPLTLGRLWAYTFKVRFS